MLIWKAVALLLLWLLPEMCMAQPFHSTAQAICLLHPLLLFLADCTSMCWFVHYCLLHSTGSGELNAKHLSEAEAGVVSLTQLSVSTLETWALMTPGFGCCADVLIIRALISAWLVGCFMALAESHWLYFDICKINAVDLSVLPKPPWSMHDVECKTKPP